ncbi:MAG: hypothetical protein R2880_03115 [Deinococcales bacterium]
MTDSCIFVHLDFDKVRHEKLGRLVRVFELAPPRWGSTFAPCFADQFTDGDGFGGYTSDLGHALYDFNIIRREPQRLGG